MDYQSNSNKAKEQAVKKPEEKERPPKVERVVTGEVEIKKKGIGQRFKSVFFGGDARGVTQYVVADVLLPAARNLVVDMTIKGVERMVYGESAPRRNHSPRDYRGRVQYHNPLSPGRRDPRGTVSLPDQPPFPYRSTKRESNDVLIVNREEAETVLERLIDILDKYEVVSVADLYDLVGQPSTPTDNNWGWTYLNNAQIRQVREGYLLDLPPMEAL